MSDIQWITLTPQRGRKVGAGEAVTMGWRKERASITIGGVVAGLLGWPPAARFVADYAPAAGLLRLRRVAKDGWVMSKKCSSCSSCMVPLPGVKSEVRKAQQIEHRVEDGALILTVPDWARPGGSPQPDTKPKAKPAPKAETKPKAEPAPAAPPPQPAATAQAPRVGHATRLALPVAAKDMQAEERREAFESFTAGMGPRQVADELGIGLDRAVNLHSEWKRAQMERAA